jgi:hypothetical protein
MEKKNKIMSKIKDLSIIILCWVIIFFITLIIKDTLTPVKKTLKKAETETLSKMNLALDGLIRIEKNIEHITSPEKMKKSFYKPLEEIQDNLKKSTSNLADFSANLSSAAEELEKTFITYKSLGENLKKATRPELLEKKIYGPVEKNFSDLSELIEDLNKSVINFRNLQDELSPAISHTSHSLDRITSSVERMSLNYIKVGENLAIFTEPQNLEKVLSLREAARFISMPLSKSAAETDRTRLIIEIDILLDEEMRKEGFNVELKKKSIFLDDFNSFKNVRIDSISLFSEKGKDFNAKLKALSERYPDSGFSSSDYMRWYYSIKALKKLSKNGITMTEDVNLVLERLPKKDNLTDYISPELMKILTKDKKLKRLKNIIVIKKIYPDLKNSDLSLPLKLPLFPLKFIRDEIPIIRKIKR